MTGSADERALAVLHKGTPVRVQWFVFSRRPSAEVRRRVAGTCDLQGQGHEWQTWRYAFHDFAPRLFQEKK